MPVDLIVNRIDSTRHRANREENLFATAEVLSGPQWLIVKMTGYYI